MRGVDPEDLIERAWGIIANTSQGRWSEQTQEWKDAATRWRDDYDTYLGLTVDTSKTMM